MDAKAARYLNIAIGVWLFLSAFFWQHSDPQYTNTWIMGLIVTAVAAIALAVPNARYINTIAGAWLFVSAFALPTISAGTRWNNFIVGIVVGALSFVGSTRRTASVPQMRTA